MEGIKNVFASKTVLTALVGAIFSLLSVFGVIEVAPEAQQAIITGLFALAGVFRYTATEQLTV